ncbi:tRNA (adenosine(37)-N6)-threonylcarbamoyltransferase complex ATPase subunit type 1 TsaE [Treponema sp. R80B11-R83G3]
MVNIVSNSPEETINLGKRIARFLTAGSVIALEGCLGSGKTCLTKGIALGLGITENITSPTYTIINEYQNGPSPALLHIDAYRLNCDKDFEDIGGDEIINSNGISIIEWSERIPKSIPENSIKIRMEITSPVSRAIKIKGLDKL